MKQKLCNRICSPNDCTCQQFEVQPKPTGIWKFLATLAVLIALAYVLFGCTKQSEQTYQRCQVYGLTIEFWTLDTTKKLKSDVVWWKDTVCKEKDIRLLDSIPPKWWKICNSSGYPTHLEYWYYSKTK